MYKIIISILSILSLSSIADDTIYVIGSKEKAFYKTGSAHFIDKKDLKTFNYKDINRVLDKVPGVYIQEEDGLGLRPNIGLRGAHPHRSKKITLLEDGILIAPAPYSAPAAYYFPNANRIENMEVFKGSSSVKYGPNSIGGAINMVTADMQSKNSSDVDISTGKINNLKLSQKGSYKSSSWYLAANRKNGELVRTFNNNEAPMFQHNDLLIKLKQNFSSTKYAKLKLSYSDEESDETYLGNTPQDFNNNPYTRYAASSDDKMKWERFAGSLSWAQPINSKTKVKTSIYHSQMSRNWRKFSEMAGGQDFRSALRLGNNNNITSLLKGERDSVNFSENLIIGTNDRDYYSQGIQNWLQFESELGKYYHQVELGIRYHRDQVERNHSEIEAAMNNGKLDYQNNQSQATNQNRDTSNALSIYLNDEVSINKLSISTGARVESIQMERDPRTTESAKQESQSSVFTPSIGFNYSFSQSLVGLMGVNKGVTIVSPGQTQEVKPEEAINYEIGLRLNAPIYLEAIAFYSDYQNIKGTCSFSGGCDENKLDNEFNGGEAEIFGLESMLSHDFKHKKWKFNIKSGYTFTVARFAQESQSDNPEWGIGKIRKDDPLPYIPQHQANMGAGIKYQDYAWNLNLVWKSRTADQSVAEGRQFIPAYGVIDTAFAWDYTKEGQSYLKINNLLDNTYLASLRPFGARPGAPRSISIGLKQAF